MRINFSIGIYIDKRDGEEQWSALVPQNYASYISQTGGTEGKIRERMIDRLRDVLHRAKPVEQDLFQFPVGGELMRIPVDFHAEAGKVHGQVPLVVEPRWTSERGQHLFCYHPRYRDHWFITANRDDIAMLTLALVRHHWSAIDDMNEINERLSQGKDRLTTIAFSAEPYSLLDQLPKKKDSRAGAASPRLHRILNSLAVDETLRASNEQLRLGVPRSPYRERLAYLLGGKRPRSAMIVGAPGSGKTMLINQWIADRLVEDGYPLHRNLDQCMHVWRLSGKRMIAGMSHLGEWEERCLAVLDDARVRRGILWFEDLHLFGRLGQSRQSERSFADFFRGPVRRGDLAVIAELTPEQRARLERDAPGLAEALALVAVHEASPAETAHLMLHEIRQLEIDHADLALHPYTPRTALELGTALFPWRARPGVAIEIVSRVAKDAIPRGIQTVMPNDVLDYLARTTGLSTSLLTLEQPLDPKEVETRFAERVIGQAAATRAATDVILKVRSGLADPNRPVSVMLFTGPTGTGKTELATAIAEYLYGDQSRLVRIDMGEMSGPDAVARLIGDPWNPEGLLTSRVRSQPFCVVLLDEIEKAHPRALHLLLQLFDEGRLTDANGEVASFASAVVIMTSNLGSRNAQPIGFGDTRDRILADVAKAVREFFPVELFNRIDQVVPFEPLTHEVAAKVVDKELGKLLGRRGLRERNTFVYAGSAVRRRAVADAFDPRYGARTVKRWLEDKIGGSLTDLLATASPARLRIVRLAEADGQIQASLEPMTERPSTPGPYLLEGALDLATSGLEFAIARAAASVAMVRESPLLARAKAEATGELSFYVEDLIQRLNALDYLFGVRPHPEDDTPEPDDDYDDDDLRPVKRTPKKKKAPVRTPNSREEVLAGIAEALLIARSLPHLLDPDAHAATVTISRVGNSIEAGGIFAVVHTIAQPAWFDEAAFVDDRTHAVKPMPRGLSMLTPSTRDVVVTLRGLFVREAIATDHGTWMLRSAAAEPDIVRVDVKPGAHNAVATLQAHLAARKELERVLEHGGALPVNPDALLPVTRTINYRPSLRPEASVQVELEDFATGWVDRGVVKDVPHAVRRAWHLAWSRTS
ncbi:MAG: AAA family ATPase [Kofleriaceae bacterium]